MAWPVLRAQLVYAALSAAGGGLAGLVLGQGWIGLLVGLLLYLVRQLYYVAALRAWVDHPKRTELPEPAGVWGEIYERLLGLQRRNRKRKKRLAAILRQFQESTEALPDGAAVLGESGELMWFNSTAQALLGLSAGKDIGQRLSNLLRHPDFTEFYKRGDFSREVEIPSPVNRGLPLSLRVVPYGDNQRLLLVRDITQLRRLDQVRRDFVANASHELRTPLTVLRGYLDMMRQEVAQGGGLSAWKAPLAEMHGQAARMEALIRDLLKLARMEAEAGGGRQEVLDVPDLLGRALSEARTLSRGQHTLETGVDSTVMLYGRQLEIESVFGNLLENAVQYTPAGGTIRVRWSADESGAVFSVQDTGIGVAPEEIPRLTERFYRVDAARSRAGGGTGLGLSIVRHALEHHEAELRIESRPGEGSTFSCRFPPHRLRRRPPLAASG